MSNVFVAIDSDADTDVVLIPAPAEATSKIRVMSYAYAGKAKFTDGVDDLCALSPGTESKCNGMGKAVLECGAGRALHIVTVGSHAVGHLSAEVY